MNLNVKRVELNTKTAVLTADNGKDVRFQVNCSNTDIGDAEPVEDFVVRHGGVTATIAYLRGCEELASV